MLEVLKRNGTIVPFEKEKIINAINRAMAEIGEDDKTMPASIADKIENELLDKDEPVSVEGIQDMVEDNLMEYGDYLLARAYIKYRHKRAMARDDYKELMDTVAEKLQAKNVLNANANVDEHSFGGRIGEMANAVNSYYALNYIVSPMVKKNHEENMIYTHDLSSYAVGSHNCLSIPFDDLLAKGFNTRQTDIRPANSINTAFQLLAVIFQLQSLQQFGGCSATHLDWTMVPYVKKSFAKHFIDGMHFEPETKEGDNLIDKGKEYISTLSIEDRSLKYFDKAYDYAMDMTERELAQAVEGMYHNLNTLQSRSGNQLPFTSINYGTCTLPEGRMVTKALLDGSLKGVGKFHRTPIFPCGIFQCMKGVNRKPEDPNYDLFQLALKSTAKRLYPNYVNVDWSGNAGYDRNDPRTYTSTMGKRKLQLI